MPAESPSRLGASPGSNVDGVLVVDDSPAIRQSVEDALANLGMHGDHVTVVDSGDDALAAFSPLSPDLVLLDTSMPGIDAYDVVQAMLLEDPDSRVVPLTEKPEDDPSVGELLSFGAFDVLRKPIRVRDLEALLREIEEEEGSAGRIR